MNIRVNKIPWWSAILLSFSCLHRRTIAGATMAGVGSMMLCERAHGDRQFDNNNNTTKTYRLASWVAVCALWIQKSILLQMIYAKYKHHLFNSNSIGASTLPVPCVRCVCVCFFSFLSFASLSLHAPRSNPPSLTLFITRHLYLFSHALASQSVAVCPNNVAAAAAVALRCVHIAVFMCYYDYELCIIYEFKTRSSIRSVLGVLYHMEIRMRHVDT